MKIGILIALLMGAVNCYSGDFEVGKNAVLNVYDGDSLNIKMRLAYIDTPEIQGGCEEEIVLAKKARDFTQSFMSSNPYYSINVVGVGRYGRPLIEVRADGQYLNQLLVDRGLARAYEGKRKTWCN